MAGPNGLEALGLILVAVILASLVRYGLGSRSDGLRAAAPAAPVPAAFAVPAETAEPRLRVERGCAIRANEAARRLLGLAAAEPLPPAAVAAAFATGGEAALAGLDRLAEDGAAFRLVAETRSGRILELVGRAEGLVAEVALRDATEAWRRMEAAEARAAAAERALGEWRAAGAALGLSLFRIEDGAAIWREGGDPPEEAARPALAEAAAGLAGPAAPGRSRIESAGRDFDLAAAAPGLFAALDAAPAAAAERTLRRFVGTVSETVAQLDVGLSVFDADHRLSLFNPAFAAVIGLDPAHLARRPPLREVLDAMRRARALPEQADFAAWRARLLARIEEGERFEETWHLAGGRTLRALVRPHASGGLAVVVENVTESIRLRRSQEAERATRRATADLLEEAVATIDPDGRLRIANGAFHDVWRLDPPALPGERLETLVERLVAAGGPSPFWAELAAVVSGAGERRAAAETLPLADGRILSARASPMPDGSTLLVAADVTAREQVAAALKTRNEALEQAEEMRSALVDQISHQMRTPLTSISGFGQLLATEQVGPLNKVQRDYVEGVIDSARDLLDAIDTMADLVALGPAAPQAEAAEALPPLREAAALLARRDAAGRLSVDLSAAPERAACDRLRLRQILYNLGLDALAKAPEDAAIRLSVRAEGEDLVFEARHAAGPAAPEAGLALALVRRFARESGGELTARREGRARRVLCRLAGAVAEPAATRRSA